MSTLQLMATAIGYVMPDRLSSSVVTTAMVLVSGAVSGVPLNFADIKKIPGVRIFSTLSSARHLMMPLLERDINNKKLQSLSGSSICNTQVHIEADPFTYILLIHLLFYIFQVVRDDIIVQQSLLCPTDSSVVLNFYGLQVPEVEPYFVMSNQDPLWTGFFLWFFFAFVVVLLFISVSKLCNKFYKVCRLQR